MLDTVLLIRLRWRSLADELLYWLASSFGYTGESGLGQRLYGVYLVFVLSIMVLAPGWAGLMGTAVAAGSLLSPPSRALVLDDLPAAVVAWQLLLGVLALRRSPIKLTFPDGAYVAGSPVGRGSVAGVWFAFSMIPRLLGVAIPLALVGVGLSQSASLGQATLVGLTWIGLILPLACLSWALAWAAGCVRLAWPAAAPPGVLWLVPFLTLVPAMLAPHWLLWPGRTLATTNIGRAPVLGLAAAVAVVAMVAAGSRANLTIAVEESRRYARLQTLGVLGFLISPTNALQTFRQATQVARKPILHLPAAPAAGAAFARSLVMSARRPSRLLLLFVWGGLMAGIAAFLIQTHTNPWVWAYWVAAFVITAPGSVVADFRTDIEQPFLRQFTPAGVAGLLVADSVLPTLALGLGGVVGWLLRPWSPSMAGAGMLLIMATAIVVALSLALSLLPLTPSNFRPSRALVTAITGGTIVGAGVLSQSVTGGIVVALGWILLGVSVVNSSGGLRQPPPRAAASS